jgi:hypothetical protein
MMVHQGSSMNAQSHSVQFYHDDMFLTESVARFIAEGLQANETILIVATLQHADELHKVLTKEQVAHPKLVFVDAEEQLPKFMINDWPSELRFRRVIDGMLGHARQSGPVRIFGEMVAVLWAKGYTRAALRLEELWNKLVEEYSLTLLCAYPIAKMSQENGHESVCGISQLHTHVLTQSGDTISHH